MNRPPLPTLENAVNGLMKRHHVPAASAAVVSEHGLSWGGAWGTLRPQTDQLVSTKTPFLLASVAKLVTAIACMKAVEDGLVDLDRDLGEILPFPLGYPNSTKCAITLRMLLSHTAGLRDKQGELAKNYVVGDSSIELGVFLGKALAIRSFWGDDAPGKSYAYSNIRIALAAYAIEKVCGVAFSAWSDAKLFGPLAMNETSWHLVNLEADAIASPCSWSATDKWIVHPHYGYPDYPDGQLRSSTEDMSRLVASLFDKKIGALNDKSIADMLHPWFPEIAPQQGLGWQCKKVGERKLFGHVGLDRGVSTCVEIDITAKQGIVVLANSEGGLKESGGAFSFIGQMRTKLWRIADQAKSCGGPL